MRSDDVRMGMSSVCRGGEDEQRLIENNAICGEDAIACWSIGAVEYWKTVKWLFD
jgi:hypothetical protein